MTNDALKPSVLAVKLIPTWTIKWQSNLICQKVTKV